MPEDKTSHLESADVLRQRAARARRLASTTTAPDVAEALRHYAERIEQQVRELEERVAAQSRNEPRDASEPKPSPAPGDGRGPAQGSRG